MRTARKKTSACKNFFYKCACAAGALVIYPVSCIFSIPKMFRIARDKDIKIGVFSKLNHLHEEARQEQLLMIRYQIQPNLYQINETFFWSFQFGFWLQVGQLFYFLYHHLSIPPSDWVTLPLGGGFFSGIMFSFPAWILKKGYTKESLLSAVDQIILPFKVCFKKSNGCFSSSRMISNLRQGIRQESNNTKELTKYLPPHLSDVRLETGICQELVMIENTLDKLDVINPIKN